jgi:hypothetical protein
VSRCFLQWYLVLVAGAFLPGDGIAAWAAAPATASFSIVPAVPGRQMVRVSIPFDQAFLKQGQAVELAGPGGTAAVTLPLRVLTWHPAGPDGTRFVRRGMLTFPFTFSSREPVEFGLRPADASPPAGPAGAIQVRCDGSAVTASWPDGTTWTATLLAPAMQAGASVQTETVESGPHYLWRRFRVADPQWPRILEVRADSLGTLVIVGHVQRLAAGDGYAPDLGWELSGPNGPAVLDSGSGHRRLSSEPVVHAFRDGRPCSTRVADSWRVYHPSAASRRRGSVELAAGQDGRLVYRYWRCRSGEKVPMQQAAWHRADLVIGPADAAMLTPTLAHPQTLRVKPALWEANCATGAGSLRMPALGPELAGLLEYHRDAVVRSAAVGDDWGNVTAYNDSSPAGAVFGMNRLNHCPAIFFDARRSGDPRLIEAAVGWCDNYYDQCIWWGPDKTGGTRYNNAAAKNNKPPFDDHGYMWRSNTAVNFCTKGYDSFFLAYEETGDPRMKEALDAQVAYAAASVFADRGECRNIGDVADFVRLYEYTGEQRYLEEATRLFRELRTKLSPGNLFDQGGKPIDPDPPFIEEDAGGLKVGYAKPYILGYALNGLPALARHTPDEPRLRETIRAVADFMASSQDPVGGWRYPHPASSRVLLSQAIEHAWQITQAARLLGPDDRYLDAIERVLRQRYHGWRRTGRVLSGLSGWETAAGGVTSAPDMYKLYAKPADRDRRRDYTEGECSSGSCPPEGLVYFPEVLAYYLEHRPESRLLAPPAADEPLGQLLKRLAAGAAR